MAAGILSAWSLTAASNGSADSNVNFAEGQSPPTLNNSARALMAAVKGWANQIGGAKTTGGSANAQTFTSDSVAAISTAYAAGMKLTFVAGYTNTGATTLNVDGVGATAIRKGGANSALVANDIVAGGVYTVVYNGTYWILLNPETGQTAAGYQPLDATLTAFAALTTADDRMLDFTGVDTMAVVTYASVLTNLGISPAWTTSTPTITAGSGTITTVSCTLRKLTIGKTVYFQAAITVTTNGTGAGHLKLPLGFTPSATQCANGFNAATAVTLGCQTSGTDLLIFDRNGAYPAASAQSLYVGGVMEST